MTVLQGAGVPARARAPRTDAEGTDAVGTQPQPPAPDPGPVSPTGDPAPSWEDVARTHAPRIYRLAYRLTGNAHDAEDLTQEVFVRVYRSLPRYTPGSFEAWLHRITTNLFLDQVRRRRRVRFDAMPDDADDRLAGSEESPAQQHHDRTLDDDVQRALDALSPEFRAAVVLSDIEGLTYEEVAAALGVKLGTVRSRLHRGRAQLRAALAHRAPRSGTATRMPAPTAEVDR